MTVFTINSGKPADKFPLIDIEKAFQEQNAIDEEKERRASRRWIIGLSAALFFIVGIMGISIYFVGSPLFRKTSYRRMICTVDYSFTFELPTDRKSFREEIEIGSNVEKISLPPTSDFEGSVTVYDFDKRLTAIVVKPRSVCFVKPLGSISPPRNFGEELVRRSTDYYAPNVTALVSDYFVNPRRIENVTELGFFIAKECENFDVFRIEKETRQKRSARTECVGFGTFCLGYVSGETMECVSVKSCD